MSRIFDCKECGMPCLPTDYHPYAACLMFKASRSSVVVNANLGEVIRHGADATQSALAQLSAERDLLRGRLEAVEKDAARYRWLANPANTYHKAWRIVISADYTPEQMNSAIDAAIAAASGKDTE